MTRIILLLITYCLLSYSCKNTQKSATENSICLPLKYFNKYTYKYEGSMPLSAKPIDTVYKDFLVLNHMNETIEFEIIDTIESPQTFNYTFDYNSLKNLLNGTQPILAIGDNKSFKIYPSNYTLCEFDKCHFYYVDEKKRYFSKTISLTENFHSLPDNIKDEALLNYDAVGNKEKLPYSHKDTIACFVAFDNYIPNIGNLDRTIHYYGIKLYAINNVPILEYLDLLCEVPEKSIQ